MRRLNKVQLVAVILLLTLSLTGCSTDSMSNTDMFTRIDEDKSGKLSIDGTDYNYYYLTDTRVVYVGNLTGRNWDVATSAISENGNYFKYNVEKQMVEEIIK